MLEHADRLDEGGVGHRDFVLGVVFLEGALNDDGHRCIFASHGQLTDARKTLPVVHR